MSCARNRQERRRLGQDLHDGISSQLTQVVLTLGNAEKLLDEDHPAYAQIQNAQAVINESAESLRRISRGLSPIHFSESGLPEALHRLATNTNSCRFEHESHASALTVEQKTHLYWIAQEAVTNARKYAEADEIVIRLRSTDYATVLIVEDNGRGFDPSELPDGEAGLGLRTMQYRAELLGGDLTIDSSRSEGTRVECRLRLPIDS